MESGINIKTLEGKKKYFVILWLLVSSIFAFAQVSSGKYPDSKYRDSIQTFYYELYDLYLYGYPCSYESFDCLKKLFNGKSPVSYSSYECFSNDSPVSFFVSTSIYAVEDCLIEVHEHNDNFYWHSSTFTKDIPNTFGVKMGMTLDELKDIFGQETDEWNSGLFGESVRFIFENGRLKKIYIYYQDTE